MDDTGFTHVSLQAKVIGDVGDLLRVGLWAFYKVGLKRCAHCTLQAGSPLPFSGVDKHPLNLVHLSGMDIEKGITELV